MFNIIHVHTLLKRDVALFLRNTILEIRLLSHLDSCNVLYSCQISGWWWTFFEIHKNGKADIWQMHHWSITTITGKPHSWYKNHFHQHFLSNAAYSSVNRENIVSYEPSEAVLIRSICWLLKPPPPKGKAWWRDSTYFRAWKRKLDGKNCLISRMVNLASSVVG